MPPRANGSAIHSSIASSVQGLPLTDPYLSALCHSVSTDLEVWLQTGHHTWSEDLSSWSIRLKPAHERTSALLFSSVFLGLVSSLPSPWASLLAAVFWLACDPQHHPVFQPEITERRVQPYRRCASAAVEDFTVGVQKFNPSSKHFFSLSSFSFVIVFSPFPYLSSLSRP